MDANLAIICALTFVIHLIGTLAYAARIAGVRTGHIATALLIGPRSALDMGVELPPGQSNLLSRIVRNPQDAGRPPRERA